MDSVCLIYRIMVVDVLNISEVILQLQTLDSLEKEIGKGVGLGCYSVKSKRDFLKFK